jgi:hypothetical protein
MGAYLKSFFERLHRWVPIFFAVAALIGLAQHRFQISYVGVAGWLYEQYAHLRSTVFWLVLWLPRRWVNWHISPYEQDAIVAYVLIGLSIRRAEISVDIWVVNAIARLKKQLEDGTFKLNWSLSLPPLRPRGLRRIRNALVMAWKDLRSAVEQRLNPFDLLLALLWPLIIVGGSKHLAAIRYGYVPGVFPGWSWRKLWMFVGVIAMYVLSVCAFLLWEVLSGGHLSSPGSGH